MNGVVGFGRPSSSEQLNNSFMTNVNMDKKLASWDINYNPFANSLILGELSDDYFTGGTVLFN